MEPILRKERNKMASLMSKKEERASMREFNKRPGEKEKLKAIKNKSRKQIHGNELIKGQHKGMVKGSLKHSKEDLKESAKHMEKHKR